MQFSRFSGVLKRLAWLWGALVGAIFIPLLMEVSYFVAGTHLPIPTGFVPPFYLGGVLSAWGKFADNNGMWCALLGGCGAMLCMGYRSLKWRLFCAFVGLGTTVYYSWLLWDFWHWAPFAGTWIRWLEIATGTPLLLASLLVLFFALLLRSPRPLAA